MFNILNAWNNHGEKFGPQTLRLEPHNTIQGLTLEVNKSVAPEGYGHEVTSQAYFMFFFIYRNKTGR